MSTFRKKDDELLVYGYVHEPILNVLQIPTEIIEICLKFYMEIYKILQFSDNKELHYISNDGLLLTDNRTCVKRVFDETSTFHECRYVLADIEPVTNGIHCWRVQV